MISHVSTRILRVSSQLRKPETRLPVVPDGSWKHREKHQTLQLSCCRPPPPSSHRRDCGPVGSFEEAKSRARVVLNGAAGARRSKTASSAFVLLRSEQHVKGEFPDWQVVAPPWHRVNLSLYEASPHARKKTLP